MKEKFNEERFLTDVALINNIIKTGDGDELKEAAAAICDYKMPQCPEKKAIVSALCAVMIYCHMTNVPRWTMVRSTALIYSFDEMNEVIRNKTGCGNRLSEEWQKVLDVPEDVEAKKYLKQVWSHIFYITQNMYN